jgi:hypothetical protein
VFAVNVPVAAFAVYVTWREIHEPAGRDPAERVDAAGIATLTLALVALLLALDEVTSLGWGDPPIVGLLSVFVVGMAAFVAVERRMGASALAARDVMRNREFAAACAAVPLTAGTFFASLLYLPQFFQKLLNYSPLEAGLALLPLMATFAVISFVAGWLYGRLGAKPIHASGASLIVAGILLLSFVGTEADYAETVPGMMVLGIGFGLFVSTITTAAVTALAPSRASLGGAILYMFQVAGGSIGLALTTTVFARASQAQLASDLGSLGAGASEQDVRDVQGILAGTDSAKRVAEQLPGEAETIERLVRDAFVHGMSVAFRVDGALALGGLVVTVLFVGGALRVRHGAIDDTARARP